MRRLTIIFFLSLLCAVSMAQPRDLSTLPSYDCSLKKIMAITGRPTLIVSPDKRTGLETILNDYCATFGNNCIRKTEAELTDSDYVKDILFVGALADIKSWRKFNTPVHIIENGFSINDKKFTDKSDGFVFVDTNRIMISGNSLSAVKDAQPALTGGHDIVIIQNGKITFFGNRTGNQFNWFNLQNLKSTNYTKENSELFSAIYISKTFKDVIDFSKLDEQLKWYAAQFLSVYNLKMPAKKVSWFIHSNMMEYGTMSGMFGLTCPGNNSAGFSIRGEIHTNGFDTGLVKHEYSHFLFDNAILQDNNPAFFVEGCVEYVTNINDQALFRQRIEIAKKYKDTLNYADLIIHNKNFYGDYSKANYSVCGIFVKYIIDNFGADAFKKYCAHGNKLVAAKTIFKKDFEDIINGYRNWLNKQ